MEATKVCVNEICDYYCRTSCIKFSDDFRHCPYCGARVTSQGVAMLLLKDSPKAENTKEVKNE